MKIYTVSPLPLTHDSWGRDITVIYRGFKAMGYDTAAVRLPTTDYSHYEGILQIAAEEMFSESWWKQQKCDLVVVNTWGMPKFTKLIHVIQASGAKVFIRLDSNGLNSPRCDFWGYMSLTYGTEFDRSRSQLRAAIKAAIKPFLYSIPAVYDTQMIRHLLAADYVGIESHGAKKYFMKCVPKDKKAEINQRVSIIRHPVVPEIEDMDVAESKENIIMCVGRWDSYFKGAGLMGKVITEIISRHKNWQVHVYGRAAERLELPESDVLEERVCLVGVSPHQSVLRGWQQAKICLFTSRHESGPIAAEEALTLGCTVVGPPDIPSMHDLCAPSFGTLPRSRKVGDMVQAVSDEIYLWEKGQRKAQEIAVEARNIFSVNAVCKKILDVARQTPNKENRIVSTMRDL